MKDLESRKQLLIAESELNRASLDWEWQCMAGEVRALRRRAETLGSMVKATATLMAGLSSLGGHQPPPTPKKFSWWQTVLKGAAMADTFWSELRARERR